MNIRYSVPALILSAALSGCLIYPHTSLRSPELRGRVVDAGTHQPIARAHVSWKEQPKFSSITDPTGEFHLRHTVNFHWVSVAPEAKDYPRGTYYRWLVVTHPDYHSLDLDTTDGRVWRQMPAPEPQGLTGLDFPRLGDILLHQTTKP